MKEELKKVNTAGLTPVEVLNTPMLCSHIGCTNEGEIVYQDSFGGSSKLCEDCYESIVSMIADRGRD